MWFKRFFNRLYRKFKKILKTLFRDAMGKFIAELWDFVEDVIKGLEIADLSNDDKRNKAFKAIREEALRRGMEHRTNWIHIAITLVLSAIRKEF